MYSRMIEVVFLDVKKNEKRLLHCVFFAQCAGGWCVALCQQLEEGHVRVDVGGNAP